jgi:hypothetical protein
LITISQLNWAERSRGIVSVSAVIGDRDDSRAGGPSPELAAHLPGLVKDAMRDAGGNRAAEIRKVLRDLADEDQRWA